MPNAKITMLRMSLIVLFYGPYVNHNAKNKRISISSKFQLKKKYAQPSSTAKKPDSPSRKMNTGGGARSPAHAYTFNAIYAARFLNSQKLSNCMNPQPA
jgi:hypothetical protein